MQKKLTAKARLKLEIKKENLRYTTDEEPGIFREKFGSKFNYYDDEGKRIRDIKTLHRINSLTIPPGWKKVWIAKFANGHLQATGMDDRKRKQYIYHEDWVNKCQEDKFSKMVDFGRALPKIRGKVAYELRGRELDKSKILATALWLLDKTFIRIGNEEYVRDNNSYGLTTLRNKHAKVKGDEITFRFRGKSGVENIIEVENPRIAKTIKQCIELPGYQLLQFIDDENNRHVIDSADVNEFLRDLTNDDFTAKDFRTWGATNLSANHLHRKGNGLDMENIKQNILEATKHAAKHLNNTLAVCRTYYIHPAVPDAYRKNKLVAHYNSYRGRELPWLTWQENALINLMQKHS